MRSCALTAETCCLKPVSQQISTKRQHFLTRHSPSAVPFHIGDPKCLTALDITTDCLLHLSHVKRFIDRRWHESWPTPDISSFAHYRTGIIHRSQQTLRSHDSSEGSAKISSHLVHSSLIQSIESLLDVVQDHPYAIALSLFILYLVILLTQLFIRTLSPAILLIGISSKPPYLPSSRSLNPGRRNLADSAWPVH